MKGRLYEVIGKSTMAKLFLFFGSVVFASAAFAHVETVEQGVHFKIDRVDFGLPPRRTAIGTDAPLAGNVPAGWQPGTRYVTGREEMFPRETKYPEWRPAPHVPNFMSENFEPTYARERDLTSTQKRSVAYRVFRAEWYTGLKGARRLLQTGLRNPNATWADACLSEAAHRLMAQKRPTPAELRQVDSAMRVLLRARPQSQFAADAYGWLGAVDYRRGRFDRAVRHYGQMERRSTLPQLRARAYESERLCRLANGNRADAAIAALRRLYVFGEMDTPASPAFRSVVEGFSGTDAKRFWKRLARDPHLLACYVDYRTDMTPVNDDLLRRIAGALASVSASADRTRMQARVAEMAITLREPKLARRFAKAALAGPWHEDARNLATFVLATLDWRAGHLEKSRDAYKWIVRYSPGSYLAPAAEQNAALLSERTGDLIEALERYDDLGYSFDFAYLADARIPVDRLAAYLRRPRVHRRTLLTFTVGMRYLRESRFTQAERMFRHLSNAQMHWCLTIDSRFRDDFPELQNPRKTVRDLRHLEAAARKARGDEGKARAMLDLANYYYAHRSLLLYCPRLWNATRTVAIQYSWNGNAATPMDDRVLRRYHEEHECYAATIRICREIVREYPHTRAAAYAAYRAGTAGERLANMSGYWRWVDRREDLLKAAVRDFRFAANSKDPVLARKAAKYARVFTAERQDSRKNPLWESMSLRRFDPGDHPAN